MRACVLNATKMGVYDISKGYVTEATGWSRKDIKTSFCSATLAGFFMTVRVVVAHLTRDVCYGFAGPFFLTRFLFFCSLYALPL